MKQLKTLLLIVCCLVPGLVIAGVDKVAVVDADKALRNSNQAKAFQAQMSEQFAPEFQRLQGLADEGKALNEKIQKEADFLSDADKKALLLKVQSKGAEFQKLRSDLAKLEQQRWNVFIKEIGPKVSDIMNGLVKKHALDLIIRKEAAFYVNPQLDLTAEVIEELNKQ